MAVLLGASAFVSMTTAAAQTAPPQYGNGQGYAQDQNNVPPQAGWDVPPPNFTQNQANGFRDGIVAAQDDIAHKIQPNASRRPEYKDPPKMSFLQRVMYRDGFTKGYQRAMDQFYGVPAPPPPPPVVVVAPPPPPPAPSYGDMMTIRHQGYQEGMLGALQDLDSHRRGDAGGRDEFRRPHVPFAMQEAYREGFRRGYDEGMRALTAAPDEWRRGPMSDIRMRGYRDGAEGAMRDWASNRRLDPFGRDEFRRPNTPPGAQEPYREGFRRGYQRIADALNGYMGHR
ncbi:MAG: hypothetical protein P4K83_10560 [Terracidiphilus sp.]|nr:hypothetical protein [Terracidiphilus sp.]